MFIISSATIATVDKELADFIDTFAQGQYDGCVTATHRMMTYRDNNGCVRRSYESDPVQCLDTNTVNYIASIQKEHGSEYAGKLALQIAESQIIASIDLTDETIHCKNIDEYIKALIDRKYEIKNTNAYTEDAEIVKATILD